MFDVKDKVFLITGAASGIGAGVTRTLLDRGAKNIAVLDVNKQAGEDFAKELNTKHGAQKVIFIKCDVATSDLDEAFDETVKQFGYIDCVINNAGLMNDHPDIYEKEMLVNVSGLIKGSMKAYNLMRKDRDGRGGTIINISSIVALIQTPLLPIYSATKSAVLQFSNCLGMEQNYSRSDVRVIAICFGITDTNLIRGRIGCIDEGVEERMMVAIKKFPAQCVDSAVEGLLAAYEKADSGSTWLVTTDRPAEEITNNVKKAFQILGQGVFD
ncbi:15-hydroxyprostaglandin dehydrogenase [NAD(+)]-like [Maniola hyperantus]|uniref:15-hydroxyprostaglandin dehydrogenase [NAD(+)]-like n=1 Tax=Aphantopus hyperantus TaxID=2795564 RepID=UPI0015685AF1|nr:15-hydroxyprostaglandin dehydrogenase [NAD(+)]-like [Maniola hyperantus]